VCLNTRKAARALTNAYDEALAPAGLRFTQFSLLAQNAGTGPYINNSLAIAKDFDQTTVSRNVEQLRKLKLLSTNRTGGTRALALTAAGQAALNRAYPLWASRQSTFLAGVGGEAEWPKLRGDLAHLSDNC